MSFLNPVNEPVLRFSSTDANAPQINYNARVAGDVKTVLKACLVTGYGAKPSAGWSIVNEAGSVAEFVSPSTHMASYSLGVDDSSAASSQWFYINDAVRTNTGSVVSKVVSVPTRVDFTKCGWDMLVTEQGFLLVENYHVKAFASVMSRLTYFGRNKSLLPETNSENISWFCWGFSAPTRSTRPSYFFDLYEKTDKYAVVEGLLVDAVAHIAIKNLSDTTNAIITKTTDIFSPFYYTVNSSIVAEQPALIVKVRDRYDAPELGLAVYDGRPVLNTWPADNNNTISERASIAVAVISLDYWSY